MTDGAPVFASLPRMYRQKADIWVDVAADFVCTLFFFFLFLFWFLFLCLLLLAARASAAARGWCGFFAGMG